MKLIDLPEEILVIIIRKLDLKSVYQLYQSCHYFKNILCMLNVVKTCIMRMNTMATVKTLKLGFISDISEHFTKLDVGGVPDLNKTSLLPAVKKMKFLKTLDVSYTNIIIEDLIEVYKNCPTIKNISCNFKFQYENASKVPKNVLIESQNMFKNFDNINVIGHAGDLLYSNFALWVMQFANVNELRFTVSENYTAAYALDAEMESNNHNVNFKNFNIYVLNDWRLNSPTHSSLYIPTTLTKMPCKTQYEFFIIVMYDCISSELHVSPMFEKFFNDNFEIETKCVTDFEQIDFVGNALIMLWKRSDTVFDETFYKNVKRKLLNILPNCKKKEIYPGEVVDYTFKVLPDQVDRPSTSGHPPPLKRRRCGAPSQILNYDNVIDKKERTRLTLYFLDCIQCPVLLLSRSHYLKKLTHLNLNGTVKYGSEFFNVLFKSCKQLETLNIETTNSVDRIPLLTRNIKKCQSIKNFRLLNKRIDCDILFASLSKCKKLENVHIVDMARENNNLSDPTVLIKNCVNLYNIFIHCSMSQSAKQKKYKAYKVLKAEFNRPYLNVLLSSMHAEGNYRHDPFIDVFRLNPIRPYE